MKPNGLLCHDLLVNEFVPKLSFDSSVDYGTWKKDIKEKLFELLGMDAIEANKAENPNFEIDSEEEKDGYKQIRFSFYSEVGSVVTCYLLVPNLGKEKYPVVITLQGHSTGFHNSIGEVQFDDDKGYADGEGRGAFAVQAVKEGYVALAIEQRGMGERSATNANFRRVSIEELGRGCYYEAMTASLMGRTIIGERCFDISCAIDMLKNFSVCDTEKIVITGNSGGGTASFYAACYDERIKVCMPSSAFCPYKESILRFYHCSCNYIPSAYKYFDMQDLSALIAPRKLTIVTGQLDPSFLVEGVRRGYETVEKVYTNENASDNCKLIITPKGHWWNVDIMWPQIKAVMEELGWI